MFSVYDSKEAIRFKALDHFLNTLPEEAKSSDEAKKALVIVFKALRSSPQLDDLIARPRKLSFSEKRAKQIFVFDYLGRGAEAVVGWDAAAKLIGVSLSTLRVYFSNADSDSNGNKVFRRTIGDELVEISKTNEYAN